MTSVSVVIPHWNRADLLESVLKHLAAQTNPIAEVLVVDNGSLDNSEQVAKARGVRWIPLGENRGFAAAVNRGIAESVSPLTAILNNDVTFGPEWLAMLVRALERFPEAGFAAGKLLRQDDPSLIDGTWDAVSRAGCAWRCGSGRPDGPSWNREREVRFVPLTAAIFRRNLFDRVGLLDERFESYLEDVDLGLRCAEAGILGRYVPDAVAWHRGSATLGRWNRDTVRRIARNQIFLCVKHLRGAFGWEKVVGQLLWGYVAARHGAGWAFVVGKCEGFRQASRIRRQGRLAEQVALAVSASEQEILALQQEIGFDRYWRWYFRLTGRLQWGL